MHSQHIVTPGGEVAKGLRNSHTAAPNGVLHHTNGFHHANGAVNHKSEIDPTSPLLLPISPLQPYHNNGKFREILEDIVASNLSVIIIISDLPKKYTFIMEGEDEISSEKKASALGPAWLKKNLTGTTNNDLFLQLDEKKKITFFCWADLVVKYQKVLGIIRSEIVDKLYSNAESNLSKAVKNAVDGYVSNFESRNQNNPLAKATSELQQLSTAHVLEEVTMMILWRMLGYKQVAYPNSQVQHKLNERLFNCITAAVTDLRHDKKLQTVLEQDCFTQCNMSLENEMTLFDTKELKHHDKRADSIKRVVTTASTQTMAQAASSAEPKQLSPRRPSIKGNVGQTFFAANSSDMSGNGMSAAQSATVQTAAELSTTPPEPLEVLFKMLLTSPLTPEEKIKLGVGVVNSLRNGHKSGPSDPTNLVVESPPHQRP